MQIEPFRWPLEYSLIVLLLLAVAIFLPWLPVLRRQHFVVAMVPFLVAILSWFIYELNLREVYPPGDPVIRIDLLLFIPLGAWAFLSVMVSRWFPKR